MTNEQIASVIICIIPIVWLVWFLAYNKGRSDFGKEYGQRWQDLNDSLQMIKDRRTNIAREGEREFAAIIRNRSGIDAGEIDFAFRDISDLCERDKEDITRVAYALYERICDRTGKQAQNEIDKMGHRYKVNI